MKRKIYTALLKIAGDTKYHTISGGDSFSKLDEKYGLSPDSFRKANPNINPHRLQIGSKVVIPVNAERRYKVPKHPGIPPTFMRAVHAVEVGGSPDMNGDIDPATGKARSKGFHQFLKVENAAWDSYLAERRKAGKPASGSEAIDDINDRFNTNYTLADREDPAKSAKMTELYAQSNDEKFYAKHGKWMTLEQLARAHNGGPNGWNKPGTKDYGDRVRAVYDRLTNAKTIKELQIRINALEDKGKNLSQSDLGLLRLFKKELERRKTQYK